MKKKPKQPQTLEVFFTDFTVSIRTGHLFSSSTASCKISQVWVLKKEQLPFFLRSKKPNQNPQAKMCGGLTVVKKRKYY